MKGAPKPFRVTIARTPGSRTRSCGSFQGAKKTLGLILKTSEVGTRGSISKDGKVLLVGETTEMGWMDVTAPGSCRMERVKS